MDAAYGLQKRAMSSYRVMIVVALCFDIVLNGLIIRFARYTEIDWTAYMDQVSLFLEGERHYSHIKGVTGPLVYPAGFVYLYTVLHQITARGQDILGSQVVFGCMYLILLGLCLWIYTKTFNPRRFHPCWLLLLCLSKRIHSIFVLRLFNDGPAMLLLYASVLLFCYRRWRVGCLLFSAAVSIKMNVLLFAPGLGLIMLIECGLFGMVGNVLLCVAVQIILAVPFLMVSPQEYMLGAFNFGRTFKHKWSVNFKWVPCEPIEQFDFLVDCDGIFTSKLFSSMLLLLHLSVLLCFCHFKWCAQHGGLFQVITAGLKGEPVRQLTIEQIVYILFTSNFIGIVFARSLHFQFYVWYFHSIPLLLWHTPLPTLARLVLMLMIELAWNPWQGETSSVESSLLLTVCHAILLVGLWLDQRSETHIKEI